MGNRPPEIQAQRERAWAERWGTARGDGHVCDAPGRCREEARWPEGATHLWPRVGPSLASGPDAGVLALSSFSRLKLISCQQSCAFLLGACFSVFVQ